MFSPSPSRAIHSFHTHFRVVHSLGFKACFHLLKDEILKPRVSVFSYPLSLNDPFSSSFRVLEGIHQR
ncbi:hypothetical protein I3842_11G056800 [Carya illinoinensis]|uniref:Uncharacterized protein n=1 Tax=Carya illinoinensis TaxID=32201 RepID=A0A922DN80_CARIL|nr:hypothetical protein I3842_11G056800 [Carya illinoinensis]